MFFLKAAKGIFFLPLPLRRTDGRNQMEGKEDDVDF